tara:strand:+ start:3375 stop:3716 length:342 start_codon:yes stop_codon:yes gene_type:complete
MKEKVDVLKDIEAMQEFLADVHSDEKALVLDLSNLAQLENEAQVAKEGILAKNLEQQAIIYDQLMQRYSFFQNDVDINGIRLKMIAEEFLKKIENFGNKELLKEKKATWKNLF